MFGVGLQVKQLDGIKQNGLKQRVVNMKKLKIIFTLIITTGLILFAGYFFFIKGGIKLFDDTPAEEVVEEYYFNKDGYLHAYPNKLASQYLSESIGLYLGYLVE